MCKSKIHRATVTESDLNYEGSISIDESLIEAANIVPYEMVHVFNINTGHRFETYAIPVTRGSGKIGLNGAAARLGQVGDRIIILSLCHLDEQEVPSFTPQVIFVDDNNRQTKPPKSKGTKKPI